MISMSRPGLLPDNFGTVSGSVDQRGPAPGNEAIAVPGSNSASQRSQLANRTVRVADLAHINRVSMMGTFSSSAPRDLRRVTAIKLRMYAERKAWPLRGRPCRRAPQARLTNPRMPHGVRPTCAAKALRLEKHVGDREATMDLEHAAVQRRSSNSLKIQPFPPSFRRAGLATNDRSSGYEDRRGSPGLDCFVKNESP
jgi:hypothetical protein